MLISSASATAGCVHHAGLCCSLCPAAVQLLTAARAEADGLRVQRDELAEVLLEQQAELQQLRATASAQDA